MSDFLLIPKTEEKPIYTLCIGNVYEFNYRYLAHLSDKEIEARRLLKPHFAVSAENALFWGKEGSRRIVILPAAPHPQRLRDLEQILGGVKIQCIVPILRTGFVCRDLLNDNLAFEMLCEALKGAEVEVFGWGATESLYALVVRLGEAGISLHIELPIAQRQWISDYANSKIGGRSIMSEVLLPDCDFGIPPGLICFDRVEAIPLACVLLDRYGSVVLKSNRGHGGRGVKLVDGKYLLSNQVIASEFISSLLDEDDLWKEIPIIVEAMIGGGTPISTPTFDGLIKSDGSIEAAGVGQMIMLGHKDYVGVQLGKGAIDVSLKMRLKQIGLAVGERLRDFGYLGWYDVDFLVPQGGQRIYGSEINARLTGPTQAIEVARLFAGNNWEDTSFICTHEKFFLQSTFSSYEYISPIITKLNDRLRSQRACFIPLFTLSLSLEHPYLGYILYAQSSEEVNFLKEEITRILPSPLTIRE